MKMTRTVRLAPLCAMVLLLAVSATPTIADDDPNALKGAAKGAAIGAVTGVGAGTGAAIGAASGAIKKSNQEDEE